MEASACTAFSMPPSPPGHSAHDRHLRQVGCDLLEQFEPFCAHAGFDIGDSGDVAAGMLQALDEALAGWIDDVDEHNRDCLGGLLHRFEYGGAVHHQDVGREPGQFRRGVLKVGVVGEPIVDPEVVTVCPTQLRKPLQERRGADRRLGIAGGEIHQQANPPHALGPLCPC
jgi:hypothetical protein